MPFVALYEFCQTLDGWTSSECLRYKERDRLNWSLLKHILGLHQVLEQRYRKVIGKWELKVSVSCGRMA